MQWVDGQLVADPHLAQAVEDLVGEMKLERVGDDPDGTGESSTDAIARSGASSLGGRPSPGKEAMTKALQALADEASAEHRAGRTLPLDPDKC